MSKLVIDNLDLYYGDFQALKSIKDSYGESTRWSSTLTEKSIYAAQRLDNGTIVCCPENNLLSIVKNA